MKAFNVRDIYSNYDNIVVEAINVNGNLFNVMFHVEKLDGSDENVFYKNNKFKLCEDKPVFVGEHIQKYVSRVLVDDGWASTDNARSLLADKAMLNSIIEYAIGTIKGRN